MKPAIWAVANQKGGSGKTTAAVNLAAALGERGRRVLLIDLDPQGSATAWLAGAPGRGLEAVFTDNGNVRDLATPTETSGVSIVPASPFLVGLDRALAGEPGAEAILRRALSGLRGYDVVLIDTPPTLGLLAVSALVAADRVLVPVEASAMALQGLADLTRTLERLRERLGIGAALGGIVVGRFDRRTNLAGEIVERLRERFGALLFRTTIRETVRLREAPSHAKPITTYAPSSGAAADFRALAKEFLKREGRAKA